MKMRKLLSLVLVCVLISPCAALLSKNDAGTTAGQFLKLGMGGKAAAMGDTVVASVNDSTSIIWNPAGFTAYDLAINVGYALVYSGISAGINVKYVSSSIKNTATAFAVDGGLQYTIAGVKLGLAGYNLGTKMKFITDEVNLPRYIKVGAAYSPIANLMVEIDGEVPADNAIGFGFGAEYLYSLGKDMSVTPRAGYNSINEVTGFKGFTFGLGFNWTTYTLDYGLVPFGDIGFVHKISVALKF